MQSGKNSGFTTTIVAKRREQKQINAHTHCGCGGSLLNSFILFRFADKLLHIECVYGESRHVVGAIQTNEQQQKHRGASGKETEMRLGHAKILSMTNLQAANRTVCKLKNLLLVFSLLSFASSSSSVVSLLRTRWFVHSIAFCGLCALRGSIKLEQIFRRQEYVCVHFDFVVLCFCSRLLFVLASQMSVEHWTSFLCD